MLTDVNISIFAIWDDWALGDLTVIKSVTFKNIISGHNSIPY